MKKLILPALALAVAFATALSAQQPQSQAGPKPEAKPDPTAATSVAGKWNMSIDGPQGAMAAYLTLKIDEKDAKKVAGSIASDMGEQVIEGEWAEGKLTFWLSMSGGSGDFSITFQGAMKEDGSLAGTFDFGQGAMNWKATRAK
jgi:hypothetical protein